MEQASDDELDHAAEEDSDKEDQDLDKMFGAWLGELDKLTESLDDGHPEKMQKAPLRQETNLANFSYRFSMYNINEAINQGETVDLDALMADLCSIEQELSTIVKPMSKTSDGKSRQRPTGRSASTKHTGGGSSGGSTSSSTRASPASTVRGGSSQSRPLASNISLEDITAQLEKASLSMDEAARQTSESSSSSSSSYSSATLSHPPSNTHHRRTGSVGTVSDQEVRSIGHSSRSSINSASASSMDSLDIRGQENEVQSQNQNQSQPSTEHSYLDRETSLILKNIAGKPSHLLTKEEQAAKAKAEKIRVALEKIKEAQVKKLVIRVHMSDESSKTMMVDERQTVRQVLDSLLDKSHCGYSPDWALVETIPELQMERIFEDHENLVENLLNWTRDSQNKLMFIERIEKYALFKNPQNYLLGRKETSEMADRSKEALLEECFCGSSVSVPEIEGVLWLKEDGKKSWKKRYFLLRASGIYFVPKGKAKASRDLVCFLQLDHVNVYYGQDYRSKYKAPTDYCLALKHPQIQKKSQYIKYLCCDDVRTLHQWVNGIRIAKYGKQLYVNYQEAMKRTEAAYDWSSLSSTSIKSGTSSVSIPESQSNHSSQADSGMSDGTSSSHARSQSVVSSIFSEAWKRGTQIEESTRARPESIRSTHSSHSSHLQSQPVPPPPPIMPMQSQPLPPPPPIMPLQSQPLSPPPSIMPVQSQPLPPPPPIMPMQSQHLPPLPPIVPIQSQPLPPPPPIVPIQSQPFPPPPPPLQANSLTPPPPTFTVQAHFISNGHKQVLAHKFPNVPQDVIPPANQIHSPLPPPPLPSAPTLPPQQHTAPNPPPPPPPPPPSAPMQLPIHPAVLPKTFTGGFPPQTAPKPSYGILPVSPVAPSPQTPAPPPPPPPPPPPAPLKNQPPHTLPKQHSISKTLPFSSQTSSVPSLVKQLASQFPVASPAMTNQTESQSHKTPQSPPAVKAKPKWQPVGQGQQQQRSPEFPPPPPESTLAFPSPPPPPPPPPLPMSGSPIIKSPSGSSAGVKKPPLTPQRNSSVKYNASVEYQDSRRNLVSKLNPSSASSSTTTSSSSPSKELSTGPRAPPNPGKLNLSNLPLALQNKLNQNRQSTADFPSPPPPENDIFPPPPLESDLPPPPPLPGDPNGLSPKVAVVNPQPQPAWGKSSLKKTQPPASIRCSNTIRGSPPLSPPSIKGCPIPPSSSKGTTQPNFLEDLNKTLKRKSSRVSGDKLDPVATMDDMALPPPPPELLHDQLRHSGSGFMSGNISGYATLRRGPPPAPPKRDHSTKLTN
ncbi:ras-associated and pleckstrin homology domains-containing protein 1-like [Sinocyclocheilus anshuiensis]|uniref:ras-associated and pleckstrin homology domains-containing protein 1-like n=1 Tax=Sinocyclocheilus anshuiensis TaxID=1608454 RepID=UPI0007BAB0FB|nr:PREDICTED: ras-associated and pleckstrin homology domains-containing protein 1-like [Sinocyclocheilus anshuiensis]